MTKKPIRRMPHDEARRHMLEGSAWIDETLPESLSSDLKEFVAQVQLKLLLPALAKAIGSYRHLTDYVAGRATPSEQRDLLRELSEVADELRLRLRALPGSASVHLATAGMASSEEWYSSLERLPGDLLRLQATAIAAARRVPISKKGRRPELVRDAFLSEVECAIQASRIGSKRIPFSKAADIARVIAARLVNSKLDTPEIERSIRGYRKNRSRN